MQIAKKEGSKTFKFLTPRYITSWNSMLLHMPLFLSLFFDISIPNILTESFVTNPNA